MHVCMYVRVYVCKYACRHVFAGSVLATLTDIVGSPEMHAGVVGRFGPVQHPVMHDGDVVLRVCRGGRGGGWWGWWWGWGWCGKWGWWEGWGGVVVVGVVVMVVEVLLVVDWLVCIVCLWYASQVVVWVY